MTISEFMVKLACDPHLLQRFNEGPEEVLEEYDLTGKQREFLLSGDLRILRVTVEAELTVAGERISFHTICGPTIWGVPRPPAPPRDQPPSGQASSE